MVRPPPSDPDPQANLESLVPLIERAMTHQESHPYLDGFKTTLAPAEYRRGCHEQPSGN